MFLEKNKPRLWDDLWEGISPIDLLEMLERERLGIRWRRIQKIVKSQFLDFNGLQTVEIGAGTGTFSVLMAEKGSQVTIIDYSPRALEASKMMFQLQNISVSWLHLDALHLSESLHNKFDIAMSFGTVEHFRNRDRIKIITAHMDLIRPGGLAIISVPNAWNLPYRLWKLKLELQNRWTVGLEIPFTRKELIGICLKKGWNDYFFIGDSLISSLNYLNFLHPNRIIKKIFGTPLSDKSSFSCRRERGTPLDEYLSYALTLIIKKGESN